MAVLLQFSLYLSFILMYFADIRNRIIPLAGAFYKNSFKIRMFNKTNRKHIDTHKHTHFNNRAQNEIEKESKQMIRNGNVWDRYLEERNILKEKQRRLFIVLHLSVQWIFVPNEIYPLYLYERHIAWHQTNIGTDFY